MLSKISLTQYNLKDILDAFDHFFPSGTIYSADKPFISISGEYSWPNRNGFIDFIYRLTDIKIGSERDFASMKEAQQKLTNMVIGVEEKTEISSTLPNEEARALQEKEAEIRKTKIKETQEAAKKDVEKNTETLQKKYEQKLQKEEIAKRAQKAVIDEDVQSKIKEATEDSSQSKKQEKTFDEIYKTKLEELKKIAPELENKTVYAKVEIPPQEEPDTDIQNFIKEAKEHPQEFRNEIASNIKESLSTNNYIKDLSAEEISIIADKTANDIVFAVNNPNVQLDSNYQVAILNSLPKADNVVNKIVTNPAAKEFIKTGPSEVAYFKNSTQLSRNLLSSFNQKLASAVFGPDPQNIKVTFYETQVNNCTHEVNLGEVNRGYTDIVQTQSQFGQQIKSLGTNQAKQFLTKGARSFLDNQIAKLPAKSLLKGAYNSAFGQKLLNLVGLSKNTLFSESFIGSLVSKIPGVSTFLQGAASKIGIDLGFSTIKTGISTVTSVATQGAKFGFKSILGNALLKVAPGLAAKLGIGAAAGAAAGTAAGAGSGFLAGLVTGPGALITAIIGALVGLIKALWPKIKEFFNTYGIGIAAVLLGGGFITGSPFLLATGIPMLVFSVPAAGGLKAAVGKIGGFLKFVLAALIIHIGKPVIITLVSIPIIAALILLIINSGAYITPPGSHSGTIDIVCNATGNQLPAESGVAEAAICIVSYLNQFNLNPLTGTLVGSPAWYELEKVLARPASDALKVSAVYNSWLQCVGFSSATAGLAFGASFDQINACSYINNAPSGYTYYSGTGGIQSGDFFLIGNGGCTKTIGHIGVVVSVDGALISCADANAIGPGKARVSHGCYALSQLTGYFRKQ